MSQPLPQTSRTTHPDAGRAVAPAPSPADDEERRWLRLLGFWFLAGCAFWIALFASGNGWFIAGVFVCWVVACVVGIIHLAISPDTNATLELPNRLRLQRERAGEPRAPDRKAA